MATNEIVMQNAFSNLQYTWLAAGILILVAAIVLHVRNKTAWSVACLTLGAFVLRLLMTSTDPFLYDWDEQYHALVAKNLAEHPGTPMLYNTPVLPVDITRWAHNHIWLHKPPLFLWLIALSVKIFGTTPLAVKLPSIILSSLMVPAAYGLGKRIAGERTGWIAALLLAAHSYSVQLVSGFRNTDHNDVIFSAFVLFSFWAWIKYTDNKRRRDAVLVGLLVGCAILVKWLPGLLVYLPWGIWMLSAKNRKNKTLWIHLAMAVVATLVLVVPWHIRTFAYFPAEAAYEMHYNMLHWSFAMEGHEGPWYYHFDAIRELMGWVAAILAVPGLFFLAVNNINDKRPLYIVVAVLFFFAFYTLAETKMPLFMLPLIPFLLLGIAVMLARVTEPVVRKKTVFALIAIVLCVFFLDPQSIITNHSSRSELAWYRDQMKRDRQRSAWIQQHLGEGKWVVFNYPENSRASHMFYSGQIAYTEIPDSAERKAISEKGFDVAIIRGGDSLPEIPAYARMIILPDSLK